MEVKFSGRHLNASFPIVSNKRIFGMTIQMEFPKCFQMVVPDKCFISVKECTSLDLN